MMLRSLPPKFVKIQAFAYADDLLQSKKAERPQSDVLPEKGEKRLFYSACAASAPAMRPLVAEKVSAEPEK